MKADELCKPSTILRVHLWAIYFTEIITQTFKDRRYGKLSKAAPKDVYILNLRIRNSLTSMTKGNRGYKRHKAYLTKSLLDYTFGPSVVPKVF